MIHINYVVEVTIASIYIQRENNYIISIKPSDQAIHHQSKFVISWLDCTCTLCCLLMSLYVEKLSYVLHQVRGTKTTLKYNLESNKLLPQLEND